MNLTIIEKNAFEKLPLGLKNFTKARLEPPVSKIADSELKGKCLDIISVAYAEQGQYGIEAEILTFQKECLFAELRTNSKFKELTLSEVRNAFREGIRGESGPFFGMCTKSYHQFLKHYYEKPERVEGMKQYLELMNQENKVELSLEEKKAKDKKALIWYFSEYKRTGKLGPGSFTFYQTLWDLRLLKFTEEEIADIKKVAQQRIDAYETEKPNRNKAKFMGAILKETPTPKSEQRKEALKRYFDSLISKGIELESIIYAV